MLTSFGGYGVNNPTIVAFGACPSCTPVGTNAVWPLRSLC